MTIRLSHAGSLGLVLTLGLAAGCAKEGSPVTSVEKSATTALIATADAPRGRGDVAPGRLHARPVGERQFPGRVSVSNPTSPRQPLAAPLEPETRRSKAMVLHVQPRSKATRLELPIDAPEDAWVMLIPKGNDAKKGEEALRDVVLRDPEGKRADQRAAREAQLKLDPENAARLSAERITRPISLLNLDRGMRRGVYSVEVGAKAAEVGLTVEVRQPSSPIELSLTPSALQLFPDDDGYVTVALASAAPVDHVRFDATLFTPAFERERTVPVVRVGGEYRAQVGRALSERDPTGTWVLEVRAVGAAGSERFDRLATTSFGFAVPTARIVSAGQARLARDADGKVAALEVDVVVEGLTADRYEVTGTLVATDSAGAERPVAEAQVTDLLDPGTHTLTLRFDAGHAGLSKLDGSYALRGLQLYSLGTNTLYHRLGRGLEVRFPAVRAAELHAAEITPAIDSMLKNGDFDLTK